MGYQESYGGGGGGGPRPCPRCEFDAKIDPTDRTRMTVTFTPCRLHARILQMNERIAAELALWRSAHELTKRLRRDDP